MKINFHISFFPKTSKGFQRVLIFLFIALSFSLYANSLGNGFVFDDVQLVLQNSTIHSLNNLKLLIPTAKKLVSYRPIRFLSYFIDYQIYGNNPAGFRFTNILLHGINIFLVFYIASLIGLGTEGAFVSAVLFAVHPLQTESVAYISGRRDILFSLFYLLATVFFLRNYRRFRLYHYFIITLFMFLSIFSKEMGASLPIMLLGIAIWLSAKKANFNQKFVIFKTIKQAVKIAPGFFISIFALGSLFTIYKIWYWNPSGNASYWGGSMINNFLTVANIWVYYVGLIVLPIPLKGDYSFAAFHVVTSPSEILPWVSLVLIILALSLTLSIIKKYPLVSFSIFWFAISLLPVSHIIPHHEIMAEHYLYLPLIGFTFLFGALWKKYSNRHRYFLFVIFFLLVTSFSIRTVLRNEDWQSSFTFWKSTCRFEPLSSRASLNIGLLYDKYGNEKKFLEYTRRSLQIKPSEKAWYNLAIYYQDKKQYQKAILDYKKSYNLNNLFYQAYFNLGFLYKKLDEKELALETYKKCLIFNSNKELLFAAGVTSSALGKNNEAILYFQKVQKLSANYSGLYYFWGQVYENLKQWNKAEFTFKKGLAYHDKYYPATVRRYCASLIVQNKYEQAEKIMSNYLLNYPNDQQGLIVLGRIEMVKHSYPAAEKTFNQILQMNKNCAECYLVLGIIQKDYYKDFSNSIEYLNKSLLINPNQKNIELIKNLIKKLKKTNT